MPNDRIKKEIDEDSGESSPLGSTPADVEDIDETERSVGLKGDEGGVKELNVGEEINIEEKRQD